MREGGFFVRRWFRCGDGRRGDGSFVALQGVHVERGEPGLRALTIHGIKVY